MTINPQLRSRFWTAENDALLRKLEAAGFAPKKIAARLGVTPRSIERRSHHLRGLPLPLAPQRTELRKKSAKRREGKKRRSDAALAAMRAAIARGMPRNAAIIQAKKRGARPQAIANALSLDRQSIYRVTVLEALTEQELQAKRKHRKEAERRSQTAITALRKAIARGMPRDAAVLQAWKAGATLAAIGKGLGLTRQRVHQILLMRE